MIPVGFLLETQAGVPAGEAWLTADERATLAGLRLPKRRADWRLGRWALKRAVRLALFGSEQALPAEQVEVRVAESGAPSVWVEGAASPCAVSLSHSDGRAFCVVAPAGTAVGCDLERVEPRGAAFVDTFFAEPEQQLVASASAVSVRDRGVTLCWSAKESAAKLLGEGLRLDVRDLVVRLDLRDVTAAGWGLESGRAGQAWARVSVDAPSCPVTGWWRADGLDVLVVMASPAPDAPAALVPGRPEPCARRVAERGDPRMTGLVRRPA